MRIALDTIAIMFSCAINSKFYFIILVVVRGCYPYAKRTYRWQKYDSHNFRIDKRGDVPCVSAVLAILYCGHNQSNSFHIATAKL